jgi:general secretion pathway protein H
MRTSVPNRSSVRSAGFTLIEILVTLVIMALLAGLASLSVGGNAQRQARDEAERLGQVLAYASDEATLQDEELGLLLADDGYTVLRFDPEAETWSEATEHQLAPHTVASSVRMNVSLTEQVELPRRGRGSRGGDEERRPEVLVLSSGEITPFRIEFRAGDTTEAAARISSDGSGTILRE